MGIKDTTKMNFGIRISFEKGAVGWIVGKDGDVMLFDDMASASSMLKKMKADDRYSWNCDAAVVEFAGWGK